MEENMWLARDAAGQLYLYKNKPDKGQLMWMSDDFDFIRYRDQSFTEITWEDPEPTKVQIRIIK